MPQKIENLPQNWDNIGNENYCPWTITLENETLWVVITCLEWTFNYDFWLRVTDHPEGKPVISKLIDINKHHSFLASLSEALSIYEGFPEPQLNSYPLQSFGELLDSIFWRYNPHNGQYSSCLCWSSHRQSFWHRSRSGRWFFCPTNRTVNQLCSWSAADQPGDAVELANYTLRKKALFSLLWGPAAEWYDNNNTNAATWENVRTNIITSFSDGRNKFGCRMEVEHYIRRDGKEIPERTVDKGWPDDLNGIETAQHNAKREAQGRQRRQRYLDYSPKRLRSRYLPRKAKNYLMENPNATRNDFSTRKIQRDVSFQVSSILWNDEEQTKAQMATLEQEKKNLRSEIQEHRANAVEGNPRTVDPNQNGRQNASWFCNYCLTNGHTPSWCCKKIRNEVLKSKKVTFTQDCNKKRGPDHGS